MGKRMRRAVDGQHQETDRKQLGYDTERERDWATISTIWKQCQLIERGTLGSVPLCGLGQQKLKEKEQKHARSTGCTG